MFDYADIVTLLHILFIGGAPIQPKLQIFCSSSFGIQVEALFRIKSEHICQYLKKVFVPNVVDRLVLCISNNAVFIVSANEVRID